MNVDYPSSPQRRSPNLTDEFRRIKRRLDMIERNMPRGITLAPNGMLSIPGGVIVGGRDNPSGNGGVVVDDVPSTPGSITATTGATATNVYIDVTWTWPTTAAGQVQAFELRISTDATNWQNVAVTGTSHRFNGLNSGDTYYIQGRTLSILGRASGWANASPYPITAATDSTAPAQVTGTAAAVGIQSFMLSWSDNTEADLAGYQIQADTVSSFASPDVDKKVTATVVTIDGLNTDTLYYFRVRAYDHAGNNGTWSATFSATTNLIESAWIVELTADKIKAGTIGTEVLKLSNSTASRVESFDGTSLVLRGNGTADFTSIAISGGTLDIGTGATSAHIDSTGNLWIGATTFGSAPLRASNSGAVVAENITATGSFATGASGDYISMTGQSIELYDTSALKGRLWWTGAGLVALEDATGDTSIQVSDAWAKIELIDVTAPYFQVTTATGAFSYSNTPPNFQAAGSINLYSSVSDINLITDTALYIQTDDGVHWEDFASGTAIADLTFASSVGTLKLLSNHSTEGGELQLGSSSSGTKTAYMDLNYVSAADRLRLGFTDVSTFYLRFDNLQGTTLGGQALEINTSNWEVYRETSLAEFKKDIVDLQAMLDLAGEENPILADGMGPILFRSRHEDSRGNYLGGWTVEQLIDVVPEVINVDPDGNPVGYYRWTLFAFAVAEIRKLRAELDELRGVTRVPRSVASSQVERELLDAEPARLAAWSLLN